MAEQMDWRTMYEDALQAYREERLRVTQALGELDRANSRINNLLGVKDSLMRESEERQARIHELEGHLLAAYTERDALRATVERQAQAMTAVRYNLTSISFCHYCGARQDEEHEEYCIIGNALRALDAAQAPDVQQGGEHG